MHILILSELFYPHGGGAEFATYLYAKLLSQRPNIKVTVVTNQFLGESTFSSDEGFSIYRLSLLNSESVKYSILQRIDILLSSFLRKLIQTSDVVYIPRFWFSAIPLAKAFGKPTILHLHDYIPICPLAVRYNSANNDVCEHRGFCDPRCIYLFERQKRSLIKAIDSTFLNIVAWRILRRIIRRCDALFCVSKAQRRILVENNPQFGSISTVVYNPLPNTPQIPIEGNTLGYFGGLSLRKGFPFLRAALSKVNERKTAKTLVYSTKFDGVSDDLASQLKLQGFLLFGKLNHYAYERVYRKIQTVVVPSVWPEPWPYVVVEALTNGRLVIASDIGGISEQLEEMKGVTLLKPGDPETLAEAIISLRRLDANSVDEFGRHNRERFLKKYSTKNNVDKFLSICENLASK